MRIFGCDTSVVLSSASGRTKEGNSSQTGNMISHEAMATASFVSIARPVLALVSIVSIVSVVGIFVLGRSVTPAY